MTGLAGADGIIRRALLLALKLLSTAAMGAANANLAGQQARQSAIPAPTSQEPIALSPSTVGCHADSHPPAGRKLFAMACECNAGREARPNLSLIPVVIDDQHSAATG